ncbi:MAG: acetyl-CoA carboxylase biotin carboxyl carrier protein subunit [Anaerolineae bacterium]|nr:acetyl-CoA carboxylase biotin carboxyl carrier protein subunit [Anaerolineae bacterium]
MKQEFTITLDHVEYPIVVDGDTITVNGRPFVVEVAEDGTVLIDGISYDLSVGEEAVTVDSETYPYQFAGLAVSAAVAPPTPLRGAPAVAVAGTGAVLAIMPGKIVRVMVELGQEVNEGDPVCVLEAMKMENELNARQGGVVRAVHIKPGDDVEKDQVLVEIE